MSYAYLSCSPGDITSNACIGYLVLNTLCKFASNFSNKCQYFCEYTAGQFSSGHVVPLKLQPRGALQIGIFLPSVGVHGVHGVHGKTLIIKKNINTHGH